MATPLKATFYTLKHRDRAVLAPATITLVVIVAALAAAFVGLNWSMLSHLRDLFSLDAAQSKDPERALAFVSGAFGLVGGAFLVMVPLYFAFAAYEAACLRWLIRGEAPGWFGWRFDDDMWRVYGIYWCWLIAHFAVGMAVGVVSMPIIFATMPIFANNGVPPDFATMLRWQLSVQLPLSTLQYLPLIFIGVRFGPAAATSIARQRFSFLEAWAVTRDRFWQLLGSFALLWLIAGVALALVLALTTGPILAQLWPHLESFGRKPSAADMQSYFSAIFAPQSLMLIGLGYLGYFVVLLGLALMSYGVNARAAMAALEEGKIAAAPTQ
jgi:hypothetical protein